MHMIIYIPQTKIRFNLAVAEAVEQPKFFFFSLSLNKMKKKIAKMIVTHKYLYTYYMYLRIDK